MTVEQSSAISVTPLLNQMLQMRRAVDGPRTPLETGALAVIPSRPATPAPPAVSRVERLGSMVDKYL